MDRDTAARAEAAPTEVEAAILQIIRDVLGRPGIGRDDDIFDHGATSLSFVRVLAEIYQRFHVRVAAATLVEVTARSLAAPVEAEAFATVGV